MGPNLLISGLFVFSYSLLFFFPLCNLLSVGVAVYPAVGGGSKRIGGSHMAVPIG